MDKHDSFPFAIWRMAHAKKTQIILVWMIKRLTKNTFRKQEEKKTKIGNNIARLQAHGCVRHGDVSQSAPDWFRRLLISRDGSPH